MDAPFGSIVTAVITPFAADGSVHLDEFRRLLRHLVEHGSDGIVVTGTTGESPTLSDDEMATLWSAAVDEVGGTASVIAGTGSNDTAHAVALTRRACELGVDGVLIVTPYYNKPPREGLVRHFSTVARAAGTTPVVLYNIPSRCVINLEPDLVAELARIENVIAIKQANPDLVQVAELRSLAPDLALYAGDDTSLLPMLPYGACGVISVASHVVGREMARVVELWNDGDEAAATELGVKLEDAYETMNITSNPIPVKAAMGLLGFDVGGPRLPLTPATSLQVARVRSMLERHGVTGVTA